MVAQKKRRSFLRNFFHALLEAESDRVKLVNTFLDDRDWMTLSTGYVSYYGSGHSCCNHFSDLDAYFAGYPQAIRSFLQTGNSEQRVSALRILRTCDFEASNYIDELIDIAVGSSKTAREEALAVARTTPKAVIPKIVEVLTRGSASQRHEAVSVLAKIDPETAPSILREHMAIEKSDKVKQAIEIVLAADSMRCEPVEVDLPPPDVALGMVPLKNRNELATKLLKMIKEINLFNQTTHDNSLKHWEKNGRKWREPKGPYLIEEKSVDKILDFVEGKSTDLKSGRLSFSQEFVNGRRKEALFTEDLEPVHAVRLLYVLHQLNPVNHQKHPICSNFELALIGRLSSQVRKAVRLA
ncbi:MAG: HEAT repeat domain-containing protein [Cyanobacteriota/Melainabacteria group bacterium]